MYLFSKQKACIPCLYIKYSVQFRWHFDVKNTESTHSLKKSHECKHIRSLYYGIFKYVSVYCNFHEAFKNRNHHNENNDYEFSAQVLILVFVKFVSRVGHHNMQIFSAYYDFQTARQLLFKMPNNIKYKMRN